MLRLVQSKNLRTSKKTEIPKNQEHLKIKQLLLAPIKKSVLLPFKIIPWLQLEGGDKLNVNIIYKSSEQFLIRVTSKHKKLKAKM